MTLAPRLRRLNLSLHIASSVGWLGAVVVFLSLALIGITSQDAATVRGVYLVMEPAAWWTLVPLAIGSLITGVIQSLGTPWGLVRHYWVMFKLAITVVWTIVLLIYMRTFDHLASVAASQDTDIAALANPSPALHAAAALTGLLVALGLSVFKPRGTTRYGQRQRATTPVLP